MSRRASAAARFVGAAAHRHLGSDIERLGPDEIRAGHSPYSSTVNDAQDERRRRARRGLAIYFAVTFGVSLAIQVAIMLAGGPIESHVALVIALMWTPALASVVARLALREGIGDVSFRLGGRRGLIAILEAVAYPVVVGGLAYGLAWAVGLAGFAPPPLEKFGLAESPPLVRFAAFLGLAATVGVPLSAITAAGEEIGWRGYMLTRLIDAGVPRPVLVGALIWAGWHVPLILSGQYAAGPYPALSAILFFGQIIAASYLLARLRLGSGSVWPAVVFHSAWNSIIQGPFDESTSHPGVWLGEAGVVTAIVGLTVAAVWVRGRVAMRHDPREEEPAALRPLSL